MGCDIHLTVEVRRNGAWQREPAPAGRDEFAEKYGHAPRWYSGRHYDMFALLAGVRNYNGIEPIAEPRGVPDGASPEYLADAEEYGCDGHSHSWHTLADLQAYDWTKTSTHTGIANALQFMVWRADGRPRSWCRSVLGGSVRIVSNDEMRKAIDRAFTVSQLEHLYTEVAWTETAKEACGEFDKLIADLAALADREHVTPDDVRIVFFFDN